MKLQASPTELKRFSRKKTGGDTTTALTTKSIRNVNFEASRENIELIDQCRLDWEALADFRRRRRRSRKYYDGEQWDELMENPDRPGRYITEKQHINNQGKVAFVQNIIYQIVRNLIGQYRMNPTQSIIYAADKKKSKEADIIGKALDAAMSMNNITELDAALLEEFIISGAAIQRETYSIWPNRDKEDLFVENINTNRIFFNGDIRDIRLMDLYRIGEIVDTTADKLVESFANNEEEEKAIRDIYRGIDGQNPRLSQSLSTQEVDRLSFLYPDDTFKARLIIVWYIKHEWSLRVHDPIDGTVTVVPLSMEKDVKAANEQRTIAAEENGVMGDYLLKYTKRYEPVWRVKYLSPWGHCFYEGKSTYHHQEHPYAVKLSPLLDGKVKGWIEPLIDQQRYINRLISMMDFIMGASAKGVLLVPEDAIPDDMDIDDIASEWSRFNGVIKIKLKNDNPNAIPKQIATNATNIGAHELLSLQLKFIMEIGGVSSAIQGQEARSGTPSSLYAQMTQNSMINSKDMFDKFANFKQIRDMKAIKIIKQFYKEPRTVNVGGTINNTENVVYDPSFADIDTDIKVVQGTDAPVYRAIIDDALMNLLNNKMIDIKMFLEHTSLPFADKLLESINKREQEGGGAAVDPQTGGLIDPNMAANLQEVQKQANQQANPKAMAMIDRMMGAA